MLTELHIHNLAIIDSVTLKFDKGVNLITGETGAGKSLLIDALRFLSGERVKTNLIRENCDKLSVTAVFEDFPAQLKLILAEFGIECETEIIIKRILSLKNGAKNYINDSPVAASTLKNIFEYLLEMHGQFENQNLLFGKYQLEYLDNFSGCENEWNNYSAQFEKIELIKNNIEEII